MLGLVLYCFERDNHYDHVMLVKLAILACLGIPSCQHHVITICMSWPTAVWVFIDGPVTRTSGWAVGLDGIHGVE